MGFDSKEFEWADLTVVVGGRDITGIRGIKYMEEIEREPLFAKGRYAHSIQTGNVKITGELTVLQSEHEALIKAGKGTLSNLRGVDVIVNYGDGAVNITNRIENAYFSSSGDELKQGDKSQDIKLAFVATQIKRQV